MNSLTRLLTEAWMWVGLGALGPSRPEQAPLTLSLGESRLESVGDDWTSLPPLEESSLRKARAS